MNTEIITAIIASLGVGGLLGTWLQSFLQSRSKITDHNFEFKEKRYKAIMVLMYAYLDPKMSLNT